MSSVVKWSQRYRATGSVAPGKMGGHRKPVLEPHRTIIKERISQTPHLTLHKLKDELAARGVKVSHNAVWLFLGARDCGSKKTLFAPEQARSDVARRRRRWRSWQAGLDPRRLVFIDETWIKTNMAPLRGWGPKGERVRGFAPHGHWRTLTFLGALRCDQPHRSLRLRRPDQRRMLPRLCRTAARSSPQARRHRHHGQSRQPQVGRRCAASSAPPAPGSGTCRPTHPISIRSSRPSPRSSTGCGIAQKRTVQDTWRRIGRARRIRSASRIKPRSQLRQRRMMLPVKS